MMGLLHSRIFGIEVEVQGQRRLQSKLFLLIQDSWTICADNNELTVLFFINFHKSDLNPVVWPCLHWIFNRLSGAG